MMQATQEPAFLVRRRQGVQDVAAAPVFVGQTPILQSAPTEFYSSITTFIYAYADKYIHSILS